MEFGSQMARMMAAMDPTLGKIQDGMSQIHGAAFVAGVLLESSTFEIDNPEHFENALGLVLGASSYPIEEWDSDPREFITKKASEKLREDYHRAVDVRKAHESGNCDCANGHSGIGPMRERVPGAPSAEEMKERFGYL